MFSLCQTAITLGQASHGHTPTPDGQNHREKHTGHEVGLLAAQDMRNMTGTALSPMFSLCHTAVALGQARTRGMVTRPLPMDRTAVRTSILVVLPCFAFNFEQKTIGPATATSTRTDHSRRKFITLNGS